MIQWSLQENAGCQKGRTQRWDRFKTEPTHQRFKKKQYARRKFNGSCSRIPGSAEVEPKHDKKLQVTERDSVHWCLLGRRKWASFERKCPIATVLEKSSPNRLPWEFRWKRCHWKGMNWDFSQEHEKGERKKGTTLIFNRYFLTNVNTAASFSAC